jgi:hypothetical protein
MLPTKFGLIWPSSFRGEDLFNISQSETRIALGSHICWPNGMKRRNFIEDLTPRAILVSDWLMLNKSSPLKLLGQIKLSLAGSIYARSSIKHLHLVPFGQQIWPPRAILFSDEWNQMKKLYRRSYIDASYQVWFNLARQFQRRRFF